MTWNHRLVRFAKQSMDDNGNACDWYQIQEVHYKDGVPIGCSDFSVGSSSVEGVQEVINRITKAMSQPILDYDTEIDGKGGVR
jgi:hypothetical protein